MKMCLIVTTDQREVPVKKHTAAMSVDPNLLLGEISRPVTIMSVTRPCQS